MMVKPPMSAVWVAVATLGMPAALARYGSSQAVDPSVRYLGQSPPGTTPARFAPGIVSTPAIEINAAFRPDFQEFFFARQVDGVFTLFHSTLTGRQWSKPEALQIYPDGGQGMAVDMAYSPDGRELYFLGRFKPGVPQAKAPQDIWMIRQREGRWSTAEVVGPPVSSDSNESYPSVVADGSLYFTSNRPGGLGGADIYRAQRLTDGGFGEAVNIGSPPNSDQGEGDTFVSPDEQYLIFSAIRPGGFGRSDLYVSFRSGSTWGPPINVGPYINTADVDFCPMVTPDGKYLFFSRRYGEGGWDTAKDADVFWVDVEVVKRLRQ